MATLRVPLENTGFDRFRDLSDAELWNLRSSGDPLVFEYLVSKNAGLVYSYFRRKYGFSLKSGINGDELIQSLFQGLASAVRDFDLSRESRFSTFANFRFMAFEKKFFLENETIVRVSQTIRENHRHLSRCMRDHVTQRGVFPDETVLLETTGLSEDALMKARLLQSYVYRGDISLHQSSEDGNSLIDDLALIDSGFLNFESEEKLAVFFELFKTLFFLKYKGKNKERDYEIFLLRFGSIFFYEDAPTLESIGVIYNLTKERVRKIESKLLDFIKSDKVLLDCLLDRI